MWVFECCNAAWVTNYQLFGTMWVFAPAMRVFGVTCVSGVTVFHLKRK